ncbi:unnamed protein product [Trichobilharzia szidati]|nr:unnamed protein product [Trichobilharzia szidati]
MSLPSLWNPNRKCLKVPKHKLCDSTLPPLPPSKFKSSDPKLQQDLERYYKIRAAACRILSIAQNPLQRLDAAKTLLVSHAQLLSCMRLIQREKVEDALLANSLSPNSLLKEIPIINGTVLRKTCFARPGYAQLCLSDVRIPLIWRNLAPGTNMNLAMQQLFPQSSSLVSGLLPTAISASGDSVDKVDAGDQCDGYSLFCTIQVGHVIRDTRLIFDIKPGTADIEFNDKWTFDDVTSEFECIIEIYAFPKGGNKSSSLFSRRRFSPVYETGKKVIDQSDMNSTSPLGQNSSQYFDLIGRCVATLKDVQNKVSSHTLDMGSQLLHSRESKNSSSMLSDTSTTTTSQRNFLSNDHHQLNETSELCDLPLFGNICYRLVAQPHSAKIPLKSGYLWIRKLTPSPVQAPMMLYRCDLRDRYLTAILINNTNFREDINSQEFSPPNHASQKSKCQEHRMVNHAFKTPNSIPVNDNSYDKPAVPSKDDSHENNDHLKIPELSSTPATSGDIVSFSEYSDNNNNSLSPETHRVPLSLPQSRRCPDLMIPIHPKTRFLDSQPILRQIDLARSEEISESTNTSKDDFNTSNNCSISSPTNGSQSNLNHLHPCVNHNSSLEERKRALSTVDISCLSDTSQLDDSLYTQSFFSACKTRLSTSQSVDNLWTPSKTEQFEKPYNKTAFRLKSSDTPKQLSSRPMTKSTDGLTWNTVKSESSLRHSPSPVNTQCQKRLISPVDTRKRMNRISRSVEPVRRLFPNEKSTCNANISSSLDVTEFRKLRLISPQSSLASSQISTNDIVKDKRMPYLNKLQVFSSQLLTFRIATCPLSEKRSTDNSNLSPIEQHNLSTEVFEFTVTKMLDNDSFQSCDSTASVCCENDEKEIASWFASLKSHIHEQELWGSEAFSESINIPKKTPQSIRNTSARRSVAIPNDFSIRVNY